MIKAAVFDLDHTLFDRYGTIKEITPELVKAFDLNDGITEEKFACELTYADKHHVHKGWAEVYNHLVKRDLFKTVPTYEYYSKSLLDSFRKTTVKYDFSIPVLEEIRELGIKTALITNGNPKLQHFKIKTLELEDLFDEIIVSGETPYEKPDVRIFQLMAEKLNLKTEEMLYIGDHPVNDIKGSREAGCIPVWVKTTGTWIFPEIEKPEYQVQTVKEIPELIRQLTKGKKI